MSIFASKTLLVTARSRQAIISFSKLFIYMKKHSVILCLIAFILVLVAIFGTMYVYYSCVEGWFFASSKGSGEHWCNAGTFGDMFGCLTCFFTGLSIAGLLINLYIQGRQLEELKNDSSFNKALAFKTFIIDNIRSVTSFMNSTQYTVISHLGENKIEILKHDFTEFAHIFRNGYIESIKLLCNYVRKKENSDCPAIHLRMNIEHLDAMRQFSDQAFLVFKELFETRTLSHEEQVILENYFYGALGETGSSILHHSFVYFHNKTSNPYFNQQWGVEALVECAYLTITKLIGSSIENQERIAVIAIFCESIIAGTACLQSTSQDGSPCLPLPEWFDMPTFKQLPVYNRYKQLMISLEKSYQKIIQQ